MEHRPKTAIVTGGSRGMGRAIVLSLAKSGMNLVVNYVANKKAAESLSNELDSKGYKFILVQADISKENEVRRLVRETISIFKTIDVLVNNAGIFTSQQPPPGSILEIGADEWRRVMAVNLDGVFYCSKVVFEVMVKQRYGRIINISSMAGKTGDCPVPYVASKAGVIGFTKALAREGAPYGITVNTIVPGFIMTDLFKAVPPSERETKKRQIPLGRFGEPSEISKLVNFLVSRDAAYITGAALDINGGVLMD